MNSPAVFLPQRPGEAIRRLRESIADAERVGLALAEFLSAAFPLAASQARTLGNAVSQYLNGGKAEVLQQMLTPPPLPESMGFLRIDPTGQLINLCKQRDEVREQLDAFEELVEKAEEQMGKRDVLSAAMKLQLKVSGLPQRLESLEAEISSLQRSIEAESLNPANETAATEPGPPEVK